MQGLYTLHPQYFHKTVGIAAGGIKPFHKFPAAFIVPLINGFFPGTTKVKRFEIFFDLQGLVRHTEMFLHFPIDKIADLEQGNHLFCFIGKIDQYDAVRLVFILAEI